MKTNQVVVPRTLQVKLVHNEYPVTGTHKNYKFNQVRIKHTSKSRVYFTAIYNGMRMVEVVKQMQFRQGEVFVKFGSTKLVIGSYTEVFE